MQRLRYGPIMTTLASVLNYSIFGGNMNYNWPNDCGHINAAVSLCRVGDIILCHDRSPCLINKTCI
jgi:hypothetical protein